jgi:hypothetical protein
MGKGWTQKLIYRLVNKLSFVPVADFDMLNRYWYSSAIGNLYTNDFFAWNVLRSKTVEFNAFSRFRDWSYKRSARR